MRNVNVTKRKLDESRKTFAIFTSRIEEVKLPKISLLNKWVLEKLLV